MISAVSRQTISRLPVYLGYLRSLEGSLPTISATAIAEALSLNDVQVRKDLAAVSSSGKPKIGYVTADLIKELEDFLGYNRPSDAILAGAGKLGRALMSYQGFNAYGLNIVAAFDTDSKLYKKEGGDSYYVLVLKMQPDKSEDFLKACNMIAEYGRKLKSGAASLAYYDEHYRTVVAEQAVQKLGRI